MKVSRRLTRLVSLLLMLALTAAAVAGCGSTSQANNCMYCGAQVLVVEDHGLGICGVQVPCGIDGHYVKKDGDYGKGGGRHTECEWCGELECNGKSHGDGSCNAPDTDQPPTAAVPPTGNSNGTQSAPPPSRPTGASEKKDVDRARSGDGSLKTFRVTFPDGSAVDMKDPALRKSIRVTEIFSAKVTAVPNDSAAALSGASGNITLAYGENRFNTKVTAENGNESNFTFVIYVDKALPQPPQMPAPTVVDDDATLQSLTVSATEGSTAFTMQPGFDPDTTHYLVMESDNLDSVYISALPANPSATVTGAGNVTVSSFPREVTVTSADGTTQKEYTLYLRSDTQLSSLGLRYGSGASLTLNPPSFAGDTYRYTATADLGNIVKVEAAAVSSTATVTVRHESSVISPGDSNITLVSGLNTITVTVTPAGGTAAASLVYTININCSYSPAP